MKQFIFGFLVCLCLSFVGVKTEIITFQPKIPKYTICYNGREPEVFTRKFASQGCIVQATASCGYYNTYVVMVKY